MRDSLSLSDSALSKQISILEQAGYVTVRKASAAAAGRPACGSARPGAVPSAAHAAALQQIIAGARTP